ncbi:MAG: tetratricopeptide repeat protein [Verrucomicrobia bacterium]|nr:tetratricopeptide repeat protein [Verrucomicrobiota bacterium]
MAQIDWLDLLGWNEEQILDLRFTGYNYLRQGLYARALVFFEAIVSLKPSNLYDLQTLGALYLQLGNFRGAIDMCDRALAIDPKSDVTKLNKAKALFQLGERAEGLALSTEVSSTRNPKVKNLAEALLLAYK